MKVFRKAIFYVLGSILAIVPLKSSSASVSDVGEDLGRPKPLVIFFGGHGASQKNVEDWQREMQASRGMNFEFRAYPYPAGTSFRKKDANKFGTPIAERVLAEIEAMPQDRQIVLVGHSSGSTMSNLVAAKASNPDRLKLIALDGFSPSAKLQRRVATACWAVRIRSPSKQQKIQESTNQKTTKSNCGTNYREFVPENTNCKTRMCLHFQLVNLNADFSDEYQSKGYKNVSPFLGWIDDLPAGFSGKSPPEKASQEKAKVIHPQPRTGRT